MKLELLEPSKVMMQNEISLLIDKTQTSNYSNNNPGSS